MPVTNALPSKPNIPLSNKRPSVRASYWSFPSMSKEPEGIVPAKSSFKNSDVRDLNCVENFHCLLSSWPKGADLWLVMER